MKNKRVRIPNKVRAELQKEIDSICPFCFSTDVSIFEVHHINKNSSDNDNTNLIMLCPSCHSKIEKGEILESNVVSTKSLLGFKANGIEFISAVIDDKICNWNVSRKNPLAFFYKENGKSRYPVINFTFLNNLPRTIILKTIVASVKYLYSGVSGVGPKPHILKPIVKYHFQLKRHENPNYLHLVNPISIPPKASFMFQLEISLGSNTQEAYLIDGRMSITFSFLFSNINEKIIPPIFFNCNSEDEPLQIRTLS